MQPPRHNHQVGKEQRIEKLDLVFFDWFGLPFGFSLEVAILLQSFGALAEHRAEGPLLRERLVTCDEHKQWEQSSRSSY